MLSTLARFAQQNWSAKRVSPKADQFFNTEEHLKGPFAGLSLLTDTSPRVMVTPADEYA